MSAAPLRASNPSTDPARSQGPMVLTVALAGFVPLSILALCIAPSALTLGLVVFSPPVIAIVACWRARR